MFLRKLLGGTNIIYKKKIHKLHKEKMKFKYFMFFFFWFLMPILTIRVYILCVYVNECQRFTCSHPVMNVYLKVCGNNNCIEPWAETLLHF